MTSSDAIAAKRRRLVRGIVAAVVVTLIAVGGLATARWDLVWGAAPGRVGAPAATIAVETPARAEEATIRLAAVGDIGTGDRAARATADLIAAAAADDPFDALLLLGDNAYPDGDPDRLDATIFGPFSPVLDDGTALLPVLGNHDVRDGHASGQVEAFALPGRWYAMEIEHALIVGLDSNLVDDPAQLAWLEATLRHATLPWVIVMMHHPAYSAGYHGSTAAVQAAWVPIFEEHGVDLVLAGHDHDYQRTEPINGITYIVSGGGANTRPTDRATFTAYAASVRHYLDITIWEDHLDVTAHSEDGPFDHVSIDES
jgi:3',5'-cyclic AMP phosphodiesterase CpdA